MTRLTKQDIYKQQKSFIDTNLQMFFIFFLWIWSTRWVTVRVKQPQRIPTTDSCKSTSTCSHSHTSTASGIPPAPEYRSSCPAPAPALPKTPSWCICPVFQFGLLCIPLLFLFLWAFLVVLRCQQNRRNTTIWFFMPGWKIFWADWPNKHKTGFFSALSGVEIRPFPNARIIFFSNESSKNFLP